MRILSGIVGAVCIWSADAMAASRSSEPVSVMILGTYHMSNPGRDIHNMQADDVLATKRQTELEAIANSLARFKPTQVDVEWAADTVKERYPKYLAGTLEPSRNEVVQVGFRLAKKMGLQSVNAVDADGDFPYERVMQYASEHGQSGILEDANSDIETFIKEQGKRLATGTISSGLRYINDPSLVAKGNGFYRQMLRIGDHAEQPGADLVAAWYKRNFLICANIIQRAKPGDKVVVLFGSGHAFLLRQCVSETPGFELVEPNDYLPR